MRKRLFSSTVMVFPILLAFACASTSISSYPPIVDWPENEMLAEEMPEVAITTTDHSWERVKIIRLIGRELTMLPYPYWNVDVLKIDPEQITTIKNIGKKYHTPISAISVFNVTFGIWGVLGALFSQYEGEYQDKLNGALRISAFFGIMSLFIGILKDAESHKKWELKGLSTAKRLEILMRIMMG
jgi:hypothetical protein